MRAWGRSDLQRDPETDRASHPFIYRLYRQFCQGIYGWAAPVYDIVADMVSGGQWDNWLALMKDEIAEGRVLELGFGTGRLQAHLSERKELEVHGLELSKDMHQRCSQRMKSKSLKSHRVRGNGTCLPYRHEYFDMVVATFPEEYIVQPDTLREINRILVSGGKVVIMGRWISLRSKFLGSLFPVFYRAPRQEECEDLISKAKAVGMKARIENKVLQNVIHHLVYFEKIDQHGPEAI